MTFLRWVTIAVLFGFVALTVQSFFATYNASEHAVFDSRTLLLLILKPVRAIVEGLIIGLAIVAGAGAGRLLRVTALVVVVLHLGFMLLMFSSFLDLVRAFGPNPESLAIGVSYVALVLALVVLGSDLLSSRRRGVTTTASDPPA